MLLVEADDVKVESLLSGLMSDLWDDPGFFRLFEVLAQLGLSVRTLHRVNVAKVKMLREMRDHADLRFSYFPNTYAYYGVSKRPDFQ